jgi:hypothetical protein
VSTRRIRTRLAFAVTIGLLTASCTTGVFMHAGDVARTGWYANQDQLTPQLVGGGTFGQMFAANVDGQVYAQPVIAGETVFVATEKNNIYGIDRLTGARKWSRNLGVAWNPNDLNCADLLPTVGVTGTPVIDPATNTVYFFSKTYASGTSGPAAWFAHAVDIGNGAERAGFPVRIEGSASNVASTTFDATHEMERTGLLLMDGVVYAGFGGHCDRQPYNGWVVGVSTSGQLKPMWAAAPGSTGAAGIWQSGGGLVSDGPGSIFIATGNGSPNVTPRPGSNPGTSLGQSVVHLRLQSDGSLKAVDFFSPYDADTLDTWDADLASGGPVLLPATPFSTPTHPHLIAIAGKQGYLYLLDANDLGGMKQGTGGADKVVARLGPFGGVWGQVAVWGGDGGYVYLLPPGSYIGDGVIRVLKWGLDASGQPTLANVAHSNESSGFGSTAAVVSSNGTASGSALLWEIARGSGGEGQLRAYDAVPSGGKLNLRFSAAVGHSSKFSIPTVYGTRVYVGTLDGQLLSFGSPVTQPLSGGPLNIASTAVGSTRTATLTLRANSFMAIGGVTASDPQFSIGTVTANTNPPQTSFPMLIDTGQTLTVPVTYKPTTAGAITGVINVETSLRDVSVAVSSFGINPTGLLQAQPPVISFGGVASGNPPVTSSVQIANVGATGVTVNSVVLPSAPFSVAGVPSAGSVIGALSSVSVTATFSPGAVGNYASVLTLNTSAGALDIPMSGTSAPPPAMTLNSTTVAFGAQLVGATSVKSFTVTNTGGSALTITKSKPPASGVGFVATSTLAEATVLGPGQSVTETVAFTPTSTASVSDTWTLNGNDGGGERNITFTGSGVNGTTLPNQIVGNWTVNGDAARNDPWLQLTALTHGARGSSFSPTTIGASSLLVSFDSFIGYGSGADGMALVLGDASKGVTTTSIGAGGGGLGYAGLAGIAVGLDTFQNPGDPGPNSVGIADGFVNGDPNQLHWLASASFLSGLRGFHHVDVSVVGQSLSVRLDGVIVLSKSGVTIPSSLRIGFTGGSGFYTDVHQVQNVQIRYRP